MKKDLSTEHKILESARNIFQVKGLHGARMQDIADRAGINKALLHYYFRTKDQLFEAILKEAFQKLLPKVQELFESDFPLKKRIEEFVTRYMEILTENPFLPAFIIHEINQDPKRFQRLFLPKGRIVNPARFLSQIEEETKRGKIKISDPRQLIVNMLSLCIFPFAAKPLICEVMGMNEKDFQQFMQQRKELIISLILQSIKSK